MATQRKPYTRLTDEQLRQRQLEIDDPHGQPNLVTHIPEGVEPVRILNVYSFSKYPIEKAYCSKCDAKRHRDGFTVELPDGSAALLGSKCGAELWGESWKEVSKRFEEECERAGTIIGFSRILPELQSVIVALAKWQPTVKLVAKNQRNFQSAMGNAFQQLRNTAVRFDQSLVVHEKVRDFIAEGAFEKQYGRPPDEPIYTMHERIGQRLEGGSFFQHTNLEVLFDLAVKDLDDAVAAGLNTSIHSQHKLRMHRAKVRDAMERLERVANAVRGLQLFYKSENLVRVARWMELTNPQETSGETRFEVKNNTLLDHAKGRKIGLPADYRMIDLEALRRLKKL